ncbi:hypothetical protein SAMN02745194_03121 [Roseomonas rosea]|uniref:Phage protein, HK97 gp10 family n=1 Tax=Muricoccus roseus TaxID=198092 RepID=A0A1M6LC20_9PROT|nr:hypothetical protein [Roseomonas rosea]SHJ68737.1 hypothetical protein SAMN02745194_03121 [Roseomonas rosea]
MKLGEVKADFEPVTRGLDDLAKRQVPFATARALTSVAQTAAVANRRALPSVFDRPTPFTMNAFGVQAARKGKPVARVFVKDKQAEYLKLQETGGTRQPERSRQGGTGKGQAIVIPRAIKRNAFGNMARGALASVKRRKDTFIGKTPGGTGGFFRRMADGALQPLAIFVRAAKYKPRLGFQARTAKVVRTASLPAFREALAKAIATARR